MYLSIFCCCFCFFFFKQKTAYEIRLSLVGSEMCIRDSSWEEQPFPIPSDQTCERPLQETDPILVHVSSTIRTNFLIHPSQTFRVSFSPSEQALKGTGRRCPPPGLHGGDITPGLESRHRPTQIRRSSDDGDALFIETLRGRGGLLNCGHNRGGALLHGGNQRPRPAGVVATGDLCAERTSLNRVNVQEPRNAILQVSDHGINPILSEQVEVNTGRPQPIPVWLPQAGNSPPYLNGLKDTFPIQHAPVEHGQTGFRRKDNATAKKDMLLGPTRLSHDPQVRF